MTAPHRSMELEEGHESLSHSRRSSFRRCRRHFWLKYEQGLEPKELAAPLRMGGIYADALETGDPEIVSVRYNDLIVEALHEGQSHMADRYLDELAVVKPMVQTYMSHVSTNTAREYEFTGRTAFGFQDNGRLDGLDADAAAALIVENKLKGRWERSMLEAVQLNEDQLTSYFVNIQTIFSLEADQIKARYEVAKKPQLRRKQGETVEAFRARVSADILSRPEFYHVIVEDIGRTQDQLDEWKILFDRMARDIVTERTMEAEGYDGAWPKNPDACSDFGGCEYRRICWAANAEVMAQEVEVNFNTREEANGT